MRYAICEGREKDLLGKWHEYLDIYIPYIQSESHPFAISQQPPQMTPPLVDLCLQQFVNIHGYPCIPMVRIHFGGHVTPISWARFHQWDVSPMDIPAHPWVFCYIHWGWNYHYS